MIEALFYLEVLFSLVFGLLIGSFLNVVILRFRSKRSALKGRSVCFSCGKTLTWRELLPVLSFVYQRGRCSSCKTRLSPQYPLVELATGVLSAYTVWIFGLSFSAVYVFVQGAILIIIFVYDLKHTIIPNPFVYSFALLALAWLVCTGSVVQGDLGHVTVWDYMAGPILAVPFWLLWRLSRGKAMGLGDAKLALGIGWFLGILYGGLAVILAFWLGALWGTGLMIYQRIVHFAPDAKRVTMKSEIPFGPFMIIGVCIALFWGGNVLDILERSSLKVVGMLLGV